MNLKPQDATVWITYVSESRTKGTWQRPDGLRRFVIGAEKTTGDSLGERLIGLTTLDPWKASICIQARDQKFQLAIKFRETRFFDHDLLWVGRVEQQASA
jgi:hypothetical protein